MRTYIPFMELYITQNPQITFLKSCYRRHTSVLLKKETCSFQNNRLIVPTTQGIDVIKNIWLSTCSNVKSIAIFIIDENVDPNTISVNTTDTLENNNVILFSKLNKAVLETFSCKLQDNDYVEIPISDNSLVTKLMAMRNRKLLLVIDSHDNNVQHDAIIKRGIVNDVDEAKNFTQVCHEYLVKRIITFEHDIKIGENILNVDFIGDSIAYIILNTEKNKSKDINVSLEYKVLCPDVENFINNENGEIQIIEKTLTHNIYETTNDPEYSHIANKNNDTYIFDTFGNLISSKVQQSADFNWNQNNTIISGHQPCGNLNMRQGSCFKINSKINSKIEITYGLFDVLRYNNSGQSKLYFLNRQYGEPVIEPIVEPVIEPLVEPNVEFELPLPQFLFELPNAEKYVFSKTKLKMYEKYIYEMVLEMEKKKAIPQFIKNGEDNCCAVSMEEIQIGDYYYKCNECTAVYKSDNLKHLIENKSEDIPTCLQCKCVYEEYPNMYINVVNDDDHKIHDKLKI